MFEFVVYSQIHITAGFVLSGAMMFDKIGGLQLLVRKNEGLEAKQTVPSSNGYCQM